MGIDDASEEVAVSEEAVESEVEETGAGGLGTTTFAASSAGSPAPSHIELVRIMNRMIHISPTDRKREIDYTVLNNSDEEFNFLYLPLRQFVRNLQIVDEDGTRLNYYPNFVVNNILDAIKEKDYAGYQRFQGRFKHVDYKLLIQLPPNNTLGPGELRTIRLTFEADEQVKFRRFRDSPLLRGWTKYWKRKFFNIPYFAYHGERFPGHEHDEFYVVVGAPGYSSKGEREIEGSEPKKTPYKNGLDDNTRVFQARIPPADKKRYTLKLWYDLIPNHPGLMRFLALYWVIATVSGVALVGLTFFGNLEMTSITSTASIAFLTFTIGLIFALDMEWADRYQILSVIPLVLHAVAWITWFLTTAPAS